MKRSPRTAGTGLNSQIYAEASDWFVEMRSGDADAGGRQRFDAWLRKSPEHVRAYLELSEIWDDAPLLDREKVIPTGALIDRAHQDSFNVVPLEDSPFLREKAGARRFSYPAAIAASLIVATLAAATLWSLSRNTFTTAPGEQRSLNLPDGSTIELNARTRLKVRFTDRERTIDLVGGQALFTVARDTRRPFVVLSEGLQVQALGTQFDIYRSANGATTVTVLEGKVAVSSNHLPAVLSAGDQAKITPGGEIQRQVQPNLHAATAWTQRMLVFNGTRLDDVVEEFNRYNIRALTIEDSELAGMHISGVYSSTDPALLLRFLREQTGVVVNDTPEGISIARK